MLHVLLIHREEFSKLGSSAARWRCDELQLLTELCRSVTTRKTRHIQPWCHFVDWLATLLGWTCPSEFYRLLIVSQNRSGCRGVPRLESIIVLETTIARHIVLLCNTQVLYLKQKDQQYKVCLFHMQVTEYCLFFMYIWRIWCMAIQHAIMQDDLHLGNAVNVFSLSCMICIGSFHCKQLNRSASWAGRGEGSRRANIH